MSYRAAANLSALIESTEDLIWSVDLDYALLTFNRAMQQSLERNYGVRAEIGKSYIDLLPPQRAAIWSPLLQRAIAEGPFRSEISFPNSRTLEISFNPILVNGQATGVSVFGRDITDRKAAENALNEAEKKFRAIFDGALEGMFQTTFEGQSLLANPALVKMLGYDSPEEFTSTIKDSAHDAWANPEERAGFIRLLNEQGVVLGFECQFKRKDETRIWVSLNCRKAMGADGVTLINEGFVEDITERKRAEEALRESEETLRESQSIAGLGSYVLDIHTGVWSSTEVLD